jgi:tetratricopeptide (TPR) repeat protein
MESPVNPERKFVRDSLPWAVGAAALVVYLATLNHWVTLSSLALVSKVTGWGWQPIHYQPLLLLLTYPFRWLPAGWVPVALNGFAAVCASLTLMMLARSVALLPHDRLELQRLLTQNEHALLSLPNAWVPVLLASVALGLQLTFWENAIAGTGDMLDLLLFACVLRCLLEHRISPQRSWLGWATFVFGMAMANNWGMVGFLPLFLVALVRLRGVKLFSFQSRGRRERFGGQGAAPSLASDSRPVLRLTQDGGGFKVDAARAAAEFQFLLRMALLGLAGVCLVLVLPLVQAFSPDSSLSFWQGLHEAAGSYKATLHVFFGQFLRHNRDIALLLAAVSLLPVLMLSIRWSAWALDTSQAQFDLAFFVFRMAHAFLLLVCVCTVFDLPFSPRQVSLRFGLSLAFMPLYYLAALSIGYYSGFLLLLYGPGARQRLHRRSPMLRAAYRVVPKLVYLLGGLMLVGLLLKNLPAIRAGSARHLEQYARLAVGSLPPEGAVVLSGDLARLALLQAELARQGKAERYVTVGTHALYVLPSYRAWVRQKYPGWWPELKTEADTAQGKSAASATNAPLDGVALLQMMSRLARSNHIYYVEPGIEFLREKFYLEPHGLVHEMKLYPPYSLGGRLLSAAELAENEGFWKQAIESNVNPLVRLVTRPQLPQPDLKKSLTELERFRAPPPAQAQALARWYSSALNFWGVTLQRNGRPGEAAPCFMLAHELNPDNLPARVNLQSTSNLLAHVKMTVDRDQSFQDRLGDYVAWNPDLSDNGPFDEPSYCYHLARSLVNAGMLRQACQELERTKVLAPGDYAARLMLGEALLRGGVLDQALQAVAEMRADPDLQPLGPAAEVEVALLAARVWFAKTNFPKAEAIINSLLASHPEAAGVLDRAEDLFTTYGSYSNALAIVERQLQSAPDNFAILIKKGGLSILSGDFSNAIPPLTRSLELTNTYEARLNRAYAYVRSGRLDAAEADYKELLRAFPTAYRAYYWLGEIAWQNKDTNAAVHYYQQCLSNSAAGAAEVNLVATRLKSLQQKELKALPEPP